MGILTFLQTFLFSKPWLFFSHITTQFKLEFLLNGYTPTQKGIRNGIGDFFIETFKVFKNLEGLV